MNEKIIVTVTDKKLSFYIDVEVPLDEPVKKVRSDMVDTLNAYKSSFGLVRERLLLWHPRKQQYLPMDQTLQELGIRNGDFIIFVEGAYDE